MIHTRALADDLLAGATGRVYPKVRAKRDVTTLILYAIGTLITLSVAIAIWQQYASGGGSSSREVSATLRLAGLASLPSSAKSVMSYKDTSGSQAIYYVAAHIPDAQLRSFLSRSSVLSRASTDTFSTDRNYLSEPSFDVDVDSHRRGPSPHLYFSVPDVVRQRAAWFDPTITRRGRRYLYVNEGRSCEVDVNDYDNELFVSVRE